MCDGNNAATKLAIRCAPLIIRLVTERARQRVNKREHGEVSMHRNYTYCGAYKCQCILLYIANITKYNINI